MRLNDEDMEKYINNTAPPGIDNEIKKPVIRIAIAGMKKVRNFYEYQICFNCGKSEEEKFPANHIYCHANGHYYKKDFGCKKWEGKK
jgi:hypothetical protein